MNSERKRVIDAGVARRDATGDGIVARLPELLGCRPDRRLCGFAPGGKVTTHVAGQNRSTFAGRGMEFDEARVYRPGDDVRAIDWRVTARTGTVHTKLYREERERPVFVLVDCRASMAFGSRVCFKSVLAARLGAMLSWTALDGGDRIGGLLLGPDGLTCFRSTRSRTGVLHWLRAISDATRAAALAGSHAGATSESSLSNALRHLRRIVRPGALVFLVSDFIDLDDATERELARVSLQSTVTSLCVYDTLEQALPARNALRISDGERSVSLAALGAERRVRHENALAERRERLRTLARGRGGNAIALSTADDPTSVIGTSIHPGLRTGAQRLAA